MLFNNRKSVNLKRILSGILVAVYLCSMALPHAAFAMPAHAGKEQFTAAQPESKRVGNHETGGLSPIGEMDNVRPQNLLAASNNSSLLDQATTKSVLPLQQTLLPLYFDLVIDETRGWIYGSDSAGNKIDIIDSTTLQLVNSFILVNGALPKGMDLSPDFKELAIAQNGAGSVIFIDLDTGNRNTSIVGGKPFDVIYGRPGRLYSVGSGGTLDYIHVIDTVAHAEISKSSFAIYSNPRLAISSNKNFLYTNMTFTDVIYKFDITSDTIQNPLSSSRYALLADYFILAPDDSKFITDTGQVWSSDLMGQIGRIGDWRGQSVYIQAHNSFATAVDDFGLNDRVVFSNASNFYSLSTYTLPVQGKVGPIIPKSDGSKVFISTDQGFIAIDLSAFPPGTPGTLPGGSLPYADLVIDEARNLLYGSNTSGHKIDVISTSTLQVVDEIRLNNDARPMGMDIRSDGNELAVALNGASSIAFINLNTRTVSAMVIVDTTSYNVPFDAKYGRAGRLYSTGNPQSAGIGELYVLDVVNYVNVSKSNNSSVRFTPYLAISSDNNTVFTIDTADPNRLCRYDVSLDSIPPRICGIMDTYDDNYSYILLKDGSKIFTGNGQVWLPALNAQLGSFNFFGHLVEIPGKDVIAGISKSTPGVINFVRKSDFYTASTYTMPSPGATGPSVVNAAGNKLFMNTQSGIKVIDIATTSPTSLSISGGSPQSAHVQAAFNNPLRVSVQNLLGEPLSGVEITFTAPASGASGTFVNTNSNISTALTDASGIATAPTFIANNTGGTYSVNATLANLHSPASFQLTNVPPSVLMSSGSPQATQVLKTFVDPLKAIVQYAPGEPIAGVEVTFTAPVSGASAKFVDTNTNVTTAITDANGIATAPALTANSLTGSYVVKATIPGLTTSGDFQLTNLAAINCTIVNGSGPTTLFYPYKHYNCGKESYAVGVADFNSDGKKDVVLSIRSGTGFPSSLLVFTQENDGNLSQPRVYSGGNRAENMAVGDINNDGLDDIVTADFSDNKISVFIQRSVGGFATRVTYPTSSGPDAVAIDDVNNDGLKDVVIAHHTSSSIAVFTQKPDGTLNTMTTYPSVAAGFDDIAIGDVNGDGRNDVVKMNGQGLNSNIMVYLQNANGSLNAAVNYSIEGCTSSCLGNGIAIGDVTGDGRSDVILSYGGNTPSSKIAVFAQNANGSLQPSVSYSAYDTPGAVEVADVNSDGLEDVVVAHTVWLRAGVFLQQNNGALGAETLYTVPNYYTDDLDIGDTNNDGLPDIAIADGQGLVILYRNPNINATPTPTATPPYSYNPLYLSLTANQTIGGVASADEDILRFDGTNWSLFFDGSDVGVGASDLFGFSIVDADTILMSFNSNLTLNGISVTPRDVVQFDATSLGSNTAGTFSMYLNGVDVGLDVAAENIDSVSLLPDGRVLISTTGNPTVAGVTGGRDEDVLVFTPTSLGNNTSGTWALYFDGSDVGLGETSGEDIDALDVTSNGNIYLSTTGDFAANGLIGVDEDVFVCMPTSLGNVTSCNYLPALYFDGSTWNLTTNDVDAINLFTMSSIPTVTPTASATPSQTQTPGGPTITPTRTATPSQTPLVSFTPPTATFTFTPTLTPTNTNTPTSISQLLPDLIISSMRIELQNTSCLAPGDPLGVRVWVTNNGQAAAGSFVVNVNGATQNVNGLGIGETKTVFFPGAGNPVNAIVDSTGTVLESNEGNNTRLETLPVPTPPLPCATHTPTITPTATNTPNVSDLIFADGFESGNLSAWTSSATNGGDLSVSPSAALNGNFSMQALINDNNTMSVTDDSPNAEPRYRVRFYFDPNSITMVSGDSHFIFKAFMGTAEVLRLEFRQLSGVYQIRPGAFQNDSSWVYNNWFMISDAPHSIELDWRAASASGAGDGYLTLWIDGGGQIMLATVDNSGKRIDSARLGALTGIDNGTRGTYYFDAFESRRQNYIGP